MDRLGSRRYGRIFIPRPYRLVYNSDIWLIILFSTFAWAPLLTPAYFFQAHDARHSVFFLVEFDQTFRDGFWWPRWSPDFAFGYGYPLFNLYPPLAFYAAEMLHLLGLGFTTAIKTMYGLATIGAGLAMYGFVRRLFGREAGLLAALVYVYVPFHLVEIFVRSAYAEFVALAIVPLVFWTFTELIAAPHLRRVSLAGLVYGLLALTHHSTFFTFSPFLMAYTAYLILAKAKFKPQQLLRHSLYTAAGGGLGLALAAVYLAPLVMEMRFIKIEQWTSGSYNYLQHFVYFSQLFSPAWGYGYAGPGLLDDFSYQLGIVTLVLIGFASVLLIVRRFPHHGTAIFFLVSTVVIVWLMSPVAAPVWQVLPIASLVQFPWRLLGMTAFTMSIVAGSLFAQSRPLADSGQGLGGSDQELLITNYQSPNPSTSLPGPARTGRTGFPTSQSPTSLYLLLLVIVLASFNYTLPQYTETPNWAETPLAVVNWDRASIVDRVGMVAVTELQPQTSPMEPEYLANGVPTTVAGIVAGQGIVETLHHGGASDRVRVMAATPVTLQFYTYDYPGWRVTLAEQPLPHRPEPPYGLITVDLPPGEHVVLLRMGNTPPRLIGAIISGLALGLILLLFIFRSPH